MNVLNVYAKLVLVIQGGNTVSLISILLITMTILGLVIGVIAMMGASKADRSKGIWFLLANIGCAMWTGGCGVFLVLSPDAKDIAIFPVMMIYLGGLLIAYSMLVYAAWWHSKFSKVLCIFCGLWALVLAVLLICDKDILYNGEIQLAVTGNYVPLYWGWFYILYVLFYIVDLGGMMVIQYLNAARARSRNVRSGNYFLLIGIALCSALSLVFNLVLPVYNYSLIWVGPLSFSLVLVSYFYASLKYRIISIRARWMQVMAYGVTILMGVMVYMLLFYIVFTSLFKIPNPSASVLVLNFLMVIIVLILMPVINELNSVIKSMISVGQVDLAYVIKKLNRIATKNVDLRELAAFLADHLHFAYIGFIMNGRLYGSKALAMSTEEITQISKMKSASGGGVWQEPNKSVKKILDELDLKAVAELKNAKGKAFGQLIVGKPVGKSSFERRDLIQLEMIINLVAAVIDSEKHIRA